MFRTQALSQPWICSQIATFRHLVTYSELLTLGFIALFRCLGLVKPKLTKQLLSKPGAIVAIIGFIWIYNFLLLLPTRLDVISFQLWKVIGHWTVSFWNIPAITWEWKNYVCQENVTHFLKPIRQFCTPNDKLLDILHALMALPLG